MPRPIARPSPINTKARRLFDGIAGRYEGPAQAFSLFQYGRWRRFLVTRLELGPGHRVLDVCTGTGLVAMEMAARSGCRVVGLDLSEGMVAQARRGVEARGLSTRVGLILGQAESLPFANESFDAVVFTFLLRYVDDPQRAIVELARVLRPGGQMASLEFHVPRGSVFNGLWLAHTRMVMPVCARFLSTGWRQVGSFLGPSISAFYEKHTIADLRRMWTRAGMAEVQTKELSVGGALTMWGRKEGHREE